MAQLKTRTFYRAFDQTDGVAQVLKNTGYVSIMLHSAFYNVPGNFWQKAFGGVNEVALTSSITYHNGNEKIEAKAIQDKRKVKPNKPIPVPIRRFVALKVPATADGMEMKITLVSVKNDNFDNALNLMNSKEFQIPLQIASVSIGQIISVTNVIKKIFTGVDPSDEIDATYAGILGETASEDPIQDEMLTAGHLIIIADEGDDFVTTLDPKALNVTDDGILYQGQPLQSTHLVYTIIYEPLRGEDQTASWYKKYRRAFNALDQVLLVTTDEEKEKILLDAKKLWIEGNTLLSDSPAYIEDEKLKIKAMHLNHIVKRYQDLTGWAGVKGLRTLMAEPVLDLDFLPQRKQWDLGEVRAEVQNLADGYRHELDALSLLQED